jgi:hypothetical protein
MQHVSLRTILPKAQPTLFTTLRIIEAMLNILPKARPILQTQPLPLLKAPRIPLKPRTIWKQACPESGGPVVAIAAFGGMFVSRPFAVRTVAVTGFKARRDSRAIFARCRGGGGRGRSWRWR